MSEISRIVVIAVAVLVGAGALGVFLWRLLRAHRAASGTRLIECPESGTPEAVELESWGTAFLAAFGEEELRLKDCTRWPEKAGCGQECLAQIVSSPDGCLVRSMVGRFYEGKSCVLCGKEFGPIDWSLHAPAMRDASGRTAEWPDIPAETLPQVLATHKPVCWNCHVAETFRREHPDRVVDRPPRSGPARG